MPQDHALIKSRGYQPWRDLPCRLWLDPTDTATLTRWPVLTVGESGTYYLSTPDTADLDTTTTFSVEMWVNLKNIYSANTERTFCTKALLADTAGWQIGTRDVVSAQNSIRLWTRGDGGGWKSIYTTADFVTGPGNQLAHFVVTYNAGTVHIYRNGIDEALTGTASTTIGANTRALLLGWGDFYNFPFNMGIGVFRMWNTELSGVNALALYNDGTPVLHASLGALDSAALVCSIDGRSKTCLKTGRVFSDVGGTVPTEYLVTQINDKSRFNRHYHADFGMAFYQSTINSAVALRGYKQNVMKCFTADLLNTATGTTISVEYYDTLPATEIFHLSADLDPGQTTNKYAMTGSEARTTIDGLSPSVASNGTYPQIRIRNVASPNGSVRVGVAGSNYLVSTPYLTMWSGQSSGGAASYLYRGNGVSYTTTIVAVAQNQWLDQVGTTDVSYLGGHLGVGGYEAGGGGSYFGRRGISAVFGRSLSSAEQSVVEQYVNRKYNYLF